MIYTVITSKSAEDVIKKWKKSNPKLFKNIKKIYHELMDHPRTGIGHPEALVSGNSILYSNISLPMTESSMRFMMKS